VSMIPQPQPDDPDEVVLGVDTHKDVHVAAALTALGVLLATSSFPTTAEGYQAMLAWARGFGAVHRAGVECTGSYGAALSRHLHAEAVTVIEVNRADRGNRRRRGKTDTIDAEAAARAVLSGRATAIAKAGDGHVQMLRMFKLAKAKAKAKAKGWVRLAATAEPPAPKPRRRRRRRGRRSPPSPNTTNQPGLHHATGRPGVQLTRRQQFADGRGPPNPSQAVSCKNL